MENTLLETVWRILALGYHQSFSSLAYSIQHPGPTNSILVLIGLSLFFWAWEIVKPWRVKQGAFRKDFWLDAFYMFFNLFLFPVLGFAAFSNLVFYFWGWLLGTLGFAGTVVINLGGWPGWSQLLMLFLVRDFVHWNVHRTLHRFPLLWAFHKVHHSVEQLGFAAHLRYHWMENILYRIPEFLALSLFGFGVKDFFIVYTLALFIGHWNHSNIYLPLGPLKYILNNPQMHIWHHAWELPAKYGVNYGISLSVWDYIFGSAYIPADGRDIKLGFEGLSEFPAGLSGQLIYPLEISARKTVDDKSVDDKSGEGR